MKNFFFFQKIPKPSKRPSWAFFTNHPQVYLLLLNIIRWKNENRLPCYFFADSWTLFPQDVSLELWNFNINVTRWGCCWTNAVKTQNCHLEQNDVNFIEMFSFCLIIVTFVRMNHRKFSINAQFPQNFGQLNWKSVLGNFLLDLDGEFSPLRN